MYLSSIPNAVQQTLIGWFMIYCSFRFGTEKFLKTKPFKGERNKKIVEKDEFMFIMNPVFSGLVKVNLITIGIAYAEAIFLESLIEDSTFPDELKEEGTPTERWMKQHNDFFWFVLAIHQFMQLMIIAFETLGESKARKFLPVGLLLPIVQWHVGIFSSNAMGGAIFGFIGEIVTPFLFFVYMVKLIVVPKNRVRPFLGFVAMLSLVISFLPVLFIGTQMGSSKVAIYISILFGCISAFCWGKLIKLTPKPDLQVEVTMFDASISQSFVIDDTETNKS